GRQPGPSPRSRGGCRPPSPTTSPSPSRCGSRAVWPSRPPAPTAAGASRSSTSAAARPTCAAPCSPPPPEHVRQGPATPMPPTLPTVAPDQLTAVLDGRWGWVREIAEEHLADPLFAPTHGLDLEAHRERVRAQIQRMAEGRGPRLGYPRTLGGDADVGAAVTAFELLAHSDLSLLVKA